jgi:hypothetical protein
LEPEFIHGTVAIDLKGDVTAVLHPKDSKVKVSVLIPNGVLGNFTSYEHPKIWKAYQAVQDRVGDIVKEKLSGVPAEDCSITLDKSDLPAPR